MQVKLPKPGDIVRLKAGNTAMEVRGVYPEREVMREGLYIQYEKPSRFGYYVCAAYLTHQDDQYNDSRQVRCVEDFVPWDREPLSENQQRNCQFSGTTQETTIMSKLYNVIGTGRFGTFLATNSVGQTVLEMKGENKVEAFDKDKIEEVRPYTVRCACITDRSGSGNSTLLNYETTKGAVAKGDLILTENGAILRVTALDTKSDKPIGILKGHKLVTERVGCDDASEE